MEPTQGLCALVNWLFWHDVLEMPLNQLTWERLKKKQNKTKQKQCEMSKTLIVSNWFSLLDKTRKMTLIQRRCVEFCMKSRNLCEKFKTKKDHMVGLTQSTKKLCCSWPQMKSYIKLKMCASFKFTFFGENQCFYHI